MAREVKNKEVYCQLANRIDGQPKDAKPGHDWDTDYWTQILAELVDERRAEVAVMCSKEFETAEQIAAREGVDPDSIRDDLYQAAIGGVLMVNERNGEKVYKVHGWVPGVGETALTTPGVDTARIAELFFNGTGTDPFPDMQTYAGFGIGNAPIRTMPINQSVKVGKSLKSYEQLQTYLDQSDVYSVTDCACRKGKREMGDPCEHPVEDCCIQIGEAAEYYIMTGRGRKVTRQEVEQLLRRAEREGLVHQALNTEGINKSSFICNCCGCSCGTLSKDVWYRLPDVSRSNYVADVDPEKCVACGACVEVCNMNAVRLGNSFCSVAEQTPVMTKNPEEDPWTADEVNPEWNKKVMVSPQGTSPCKTKCPAHISIQGYIRKAAQGKYDEALKVIKRDNPFPAVCGRICPHSCEDECTRARVDEAMAIDDIKKFIADKELKSENRFVPEVFEHFDEKVAVIGAGPAGMTAAYYIAAEGYQVTVFERNSAPGGMLKFGIPSFRLEKNIIDAEIDVLRQLGVEFKCGVNVGKDITISQLREQGYKAFYIAIGAQNGRKLGIEGEELIGVKSGIEFLRGVNLGETNEIEGDTVVIGGGNVAVDVARAAMRLGNRKVKMVCLEKDEEMPTVPDEKDEAIAEGIEICNSWGPVRIIGENGKVIGVEFKRCIAIHDENGKFAPAYDENDTMIIPCSNVYAAIGQSIAWDGLLDGTKAETANGRTVTVADISYQTNEPDIFAGGDCATGPKFTIDAIATGKSGAISIHRYLRRRGLTMRREREYKPFNKDNTDYSGYDRMARQRPHHAAASQALETMSDTRATFTEEQLQKEAKRCLGCGVSIVDKYMCIGCGLCATKCEFDAIKLVRNIDVAPAATPGEQVQRMVGHMMARYQKISLKNPQQTGGVWGDTIDADNYMSDDGKEAK